MLREGRVAAHFGCLAQLGEHRPYKARVGGSNPSAPTNLEKESLGK